MCCHSSLSAIFGIRIYNLTAKLSSLDLRVFSGLPSKVGIASQHNNGKKKKLDYSLIHDLVIKSPSIYDTSRATIKLRRTLCCGMEAKPPGFCMYGNNEATYPVSTSRFKVLKCLALVLCLGLTLIWRRPLVAIVRHRIKQSSKEK